MNETIETREDKIDREWREMNEGIRALLALEETRKNIERERKLGGFGFFGRLLRFRVAWYRLGFFDGWLRGSEYAWKDFVKIYGPELERRRR